MCKFGLSGGKYALTAEEEAPLRATCRDLGLWGLDAPEEYGGANLPSVALMAVEEEMARTVVPFTIPPDSPNLHMLVQVANEAQREKYLAPYAAGEMRSCIAISEPAAGGDPSGMLTRAVQDGDDWVINGRKIWVSNVPAADFIILMARTSPGKREQGVTAFIVEHLKLCTEEPFLVGLGAVGPGHEWAIPTMFENILRGLRLAGFAEHEIEYFTLHTHQDIDHAAWLEEALATFATTEEAQAQIRRGCLLSLAARERLWWGIADKINAGRMRARLPWATSSTSDADETTLRDFRGGVRVALTFPGSPQPSGA